ncbi:MAG: FtsQ-type POTRA domain-containing protein [Bacilli bacterium]|nr:FtsQ-type POTRA domain-containing protein [Bacilli bacterium]
MAKKIVKRKKIKVFNLLISLLILLGLSFCVYLLFKIPTKNIIIKNTNYLNDDYILELAKIKSYPEFLLIKNNIIKEKLEKSEYISNVKISKKWGFILEIKIEENRALFFDMNKRKYIFTNKKEKVEDEINIKFRIPRLLNYVPDKKYINFIKKMSEINEETLSKISDIEYQPNEYDKDRFLLYMDDGNMVYLTLTKFKMINHYNDVLSQLENHKGILYLDNGNHFQIKE